LVKLRCTEKNGAKFFGPPWGDLIIAEIWEDFHRVWIEQEQTREFWIRWRGFNWEFGK